MEKLAYGNLLSNIYSGNSGGHRDTLVFFMLQSNWYGGLGKIWLLSVLLLVIYSHIAYLSKPDWKDTVHFSVHKCSFKYQML